MLEVVGNSPLERAILQTVRAVRLGDLAEAALHGAGHSTDRRLRVHTPEMNGESYRLKRSRENAAAQAPDELDNP